MKNSLYAGAVCLLILYGCSVYHIDSEDVSSKLYSPKKSIEEVQYVENVTEPHEVVGHITVTTERSQDREEVLRNLRKEAMVLGGDAVTDLSVEAPEGWEKVPGQKILGNAYIRARYRATVIAYE